MSHYGSIVRPGVQFLQLLLAEVTTSQYCSVASATNEMPDSARYHSRGMASGSMVQGSLVISLVCLVPTPDSA